MPFGLTNAQASFQRAMNSILDDFKWKDCLVYCFDDVIIFAKNLEEHNRRVDAVLKCLEDAGVKLNGAKCQFLQENTTFFRVCRLLQTFRTEFRKNSAPLYNLGKKRNSLSLDQTIPRSLQHVETSPN